MLHSFATMTACLMFCVSEVQTKIKVQELYLTTGKDEAKQHWMDTFIILNILYRDRKSVV